MFQDYDNKKIILPTIPSILSSPRDCDEVWYRDKLFPAFILVLVRKYLQESRVSFCPCGKVLGLRKVLGLEESLSTSYGEGVAIIQEWESS